MTISLHHPLTHLKTPANPSVYQPKEILLPGTNCVIRPQVPLGSYTSYKVGGAAQWFVIPRTIAELQATWKWGKQQKLPITLIGAGSNLLISDRGLPGLVICTRYLRYADYHPHNGTIIACAGEPIVNLATQAGKRGWEGLEWAIGIPGTVGGAVVMNAGAHHGCVADTLVSIQVLTNTGELVTLTKAQLGFAYRTSILQTGDYLVAEAVFKLKTGADPAVVTAITKRYKEHRIKTQPYNLPSCGSVFRNPEPQKSAKLIEQLGLKGYKIGGAQVSTRHANFIVNSDNATATDIYRLIRYVQQQIKHHYGVELEPEVKILGEFPD
jgi:UDP-N-acetylmuramate dehydrogenase